MQGEREAEVHALGNTQAMCDQLECSTECLLQCHGVGDSYRPLLGDARGDNPTGYGRKGFYFLL